MNETSAPVTNQGSVAVAEPARQTGTATVTAALGTPPGGQPGPRKESLEDTLRSAAVRAVRTFLQAFLAVLTAGPVLNLGIPTYKAGLTAGLAAVLALAQRLLDDTAIPSLPKG